MSSSIPSLCLPSHRHLVPVPSSSRIGYRMIPQRNPSHAIPDTTTCSFRPRSSPRPISSSDCFPPRFPPRFPPHRVARRVEPRHDAILFAVRFVCLPASFHLIGSSIKPVACPPAPTHAANPSHPSHPLRYISSAHLPSRPASSFASRRASSLVSSRLTACPASRFALLHLIGLSFISLLIRLVHLIHLIHIIYLIGIVPLH